MGTDARQNCLEPVLITGAGGFIGSYLAEELLGRGVPICAAVHRGPGQLAPLADRFADRMRIAPVEMTDAMAVDRLVAGERPSSVVHLAAQDLIAPSWQDPAGTFATNMTGTYHLLDAIQRHAPQARVIVASSSAAYGLPPSSGGSPILEEAPFQPGNPYGVSKVAQEMVAIMAGRSLGLAVIRVRPFSLIGPRKAPDAVSDFARGIVRVERGETDALSVGNLNAARDFLDVRDAVQALALLLERGRRGDAYNLCTGVQRTLREIVEAFMAVSGRAVNVRVDPARLRASDDPVLVGDPGKLQRLGWQPEIPLRQSLLDILEYWRAQAGIQVTSEAR